MERCNSLFSFGKYAFAQRKFAMAVHSLELIEADDHHFWQSRYYIALCKWELNEQITSLDELAFIAQASSDRSVKDKARSQYHLLMKQIKEKCSNSQLPIHTQAATSFVNAQYAGSAPPAISIVV